MAFPWCKPQIAILLLSPIIGIANSLDITFCSPQNTGEGNGPNYWEFQSNGQCQVTCKDSYAYGILQGNNCWCSNYAPYQQVDTGRCNAACPGFPSEDCGNADAQLYGYYQLDLAPSGTQGAPSSSTSSSTKAPPRPTPPTTIVLTSTVSATIAPAPSPSPDRPTTVADATTTTAAATSRTSTPSTTLTPTPATIVTTIQGSQVTVTVTPAVPTATDDQSAVVTPAPDPFWDNKGAVAGTFSVVAIVIVGLLAVIAYLLWKRRKSNDSVAITSVSDHDGHSTTGTLFGAGEKRNSRLILGGSKGRSGSDERTGTLPTPTSMSRRTSQPLVHDQRLNPNALYTMGQDNGSHISVGSFQDDRDYSRPVLHVRNPDST